MKVKWGVIGCGGIADRRTIPGMMLSDKVELVAVMDANMDVAEKCKEKYGAKYAFSNFEDVLAVSEIEAVYIASPVFFHKEQAIKAAKAKKHILLEKPVALTVAEAEEIKKACEENNVKISIGFLMRFHEYHQKIREIIAEGKIGNVVSMRGQFTCWYPDIEGAWRQKKALSGGGALVDMGIHVIDLMHYITGLKAVEVAAFNQTQTFGYEVDDSSNLIMKMDNGSVAYVDSNFNIPDAASVAKLEIYGTKGSIVASGTLAQDEVGTVSILISDDNAGYDASQSRGELSAVSLEKTSDGNMYTKEVEGLCDAITDNADVPVSIESAIYDQKIIEAAYKSSEEKRFVEVK
ncbi:MAG: Gfo/Idh/MocA family oxidoreductase [Clostridia bacterium]|nr:Gfo/Idh/MocA family oxidoreductase [Clostridia bacterium]